MEKINFQNGVTKVNETTFNNFQDNIEEEINSHVEHRYILVLTADVAKGGTITIPCYYKARC